MPPAWAAVMLQVPGPTMVTTNLVTVQTSDVDDEYVKGNPTEEFAVGNVNVALPSILSVMAGKVIV